ncbi:ATP-binding protein [Chitinivorax sp. B]|uniref:ATP-binding protein n=1 Tax=Chitinivorax sp. B TaxID=2502235 RepID=UPI0010F7BC4E|nr:ATP-binding protein [Chitinivorax sp. B]
MMTPPSLPARPALPGWAENVRRKYVSGEASMFVLHHNVFDEQLYDGHYYTLVDFLTDVLLKDNKQTIIVYDPSAGVRYAKRAVMSPVTSLPAGALPDEVLAKLEPELMAQDRTALIIPYASSVAPPGDESMLTHADRFAAIRLHRWTLSPQLHRKDNVVFLLTESLTELNAKIVANPRVAAVEIPLPDRVLRETVIQQCDTTMPSTQVQRLAEHTAGLRAVQIAQILSPRADDLSDDDRRVLILSLLADSVDVSTRADKLTLLTRGMDADEIRHLLNPDIQQQHSASSDPYAEVLDLVYARKREIIEKECEGLIEFVDSRHDLSAVGGNEGLKAELEQIAAAIRSGDKTRVPMGLLFVGPMGTGKTFVANCFVKSAGLSAVTLKNFRSKWVGSSEANLEKVLGMVKALGPIVLIIDEGDRSFGGGSEDTDGGTSSRIIARLKAFMSDPENRGVVLFVMMTNRPDKLDIDIKRAGRLDRKIPFFYPDSVDEVSAILQALFARHRLTSGFDWSQADPVLSRLTGYANADLEAVALLAHALADGKAITLPILDTAAQDYMPSRDSAMLEYMELQAVFEASRRSMLPARYRDYTQEQIHQRLRELKRELRL